MIHPLKNVVGTWNNHQQAAVFRWEADTNNDRYIHLIGLKEQNGTLMPDSQCRSDKDLRTATGADMLSISVRFTVGAFGVSKRSFLLFSTDDYLCDGRDIETALKSKDIIYSITIGHAELQYWIKNLKYGSVRAITFGLQSNADIAEGIVGYCYNLDDSNVCLPFPGTIKGGGRKNKFETILIPETSQVQIVVTDKSFRENVMIKEGSFIGGLFKWRIIR